MGLSDYNLFSKILHNVSLGNYQLSQLSFQLAKSSLKKERNSTPIKKVFVSGLARAGTTILTTYLGKHEDFFSLTYQDMPFPLMPNIWRKINKSTKRGVAKERKHGDGIKIDHQSIEEIEEYFWKVFTNDNYISDKTLKIDKVEDDIIENFNDYINIILNCYEGIDNPIYLSKNNNHVLRLNLLHEKLPDAYFIIPFRNPLSHAHSLLNQHKKFTGLQREDHFILKYMDWLGHHEFGLNHKYFDLGNNELNEVLESTNRDNVNYWLNSWLNYYNYLQNFVGKDRILFFCHENFCDDPLGSIGKVGNVIGFNWDIQLKTFTPNINSTKEPTVDSNVLEKCEVLYHKMKQIRVN